MPLDGKTYVIARNAHGRPTLQHRLIGGSAGHTGCNRDTSAWSRAYQREPIEAILCRQPGCRA